MFLSDDLKYAIRNWLVENMPECSEFAICAYGKYLGWWLGVDSVNISYKAPLVTFVHRGEEGVGGKAPATTSIVRYNQRCIPVLSYVAQFAPPPSFSEGHEPGILQKELAGSWPPLYKGKSGGVCVEALAHGVIHKIIRIPPKSMPRALCHSMSFCIAVDHIPIKTYCAANLMRFAHSERLCPCSSVQGYQSCGG